MTIQQQAYGLIDQLSEESVQVVIQVMRLMLPHSPKSEMVSKENDLTPKMKAYLKMQELRKETAMYDISDAQRAMGIEEKYGNLG